MAETTSNWYVLRAVSGKEVKVKEFIAPFLGRKGEIRLTFAGGREVRLKISKNGESFTVLSE